MIRIVQGNPGSGKSYYAVNYLSKFCRYEPLYNEHILNDGVLVITNIEGLRIKHLHLSDLIARYTVEGFFTVENFERIIEKYRCRQVILLIDEAQKVFDSKFYDKQVFYFFQYHRHLGIDIFLLTQSVSTISRQLIPLAEFVIEAQPRSKGIGGVFRYKFKDIKGQFMYSQVCRKRKEVFNLYKSFDSDEGEKPRNILMYWCALFAVLVVVTVIGFKLSIAAISNHGKKNKSVQSQKIVPDTSQQNIQPVRAIPVQSVYSTVTIYPSHELVKPSGWQRVRVLGKMSFGGRPVLLLADGSRTTQFRDYDWYSSSAEVPAHVAERVLFSGREPLAPEQSTQDFSSGSFATGSAAGLASEPQLLQ